MSPRKKQINQTGNDSATSDSNSSWTSEETSDQTKAVRDLKEGDIFAEKYLCEEQLYAIECDFFNSYSVEAKLIFGKPLVRLAKGLLTNGDVVLKFYDRPELYAKALSSYEDLNKSNYVFKCLRTATKNLRKCGCLVDL